MPEIKLNFSAGLTYLIDKLSIKQKALAKKIGISEQSLTDYKMGRRKGDEIERNKIADQLGVGFAERHVRQLGMMIRSGTDADEAYDRIRAQISTAAHNDEAALFNRTLDDLFAQIKEFLRDEYGETLHVAVSYEEVYNVRMPQFSTWKKKLIQEFLDAPQRSTSAPTEPVANNDDST